MCSSVFPDRYVALTAAYRRQQLIQAERISGHTPSAIFEGAVLLRVGLIQALGPMRKLLLLLLVFCLSACGRVGPAEARAIAYERLSTISGGPSLKGEGLRSALEIADRSDGAYLIELRDESRNLLWTVTVDQSGKSEISRMAIDG